MSKYMLRIKKGDCELEYQDEYCWFIERQTECLFQSIFDPKAAGGDAQVCPAGSAHFSRPNPYTYQLVLRRGALIIEISSDDDDNFIQRQLNLWFQSMLAGKPFNLLKDAVSDEPAVPPQDAPAATASSAQEPAPPKQNGHNPAEPKDLVMAFQ